MKRKRVYLPTNIWMMKKKKIIWMKKKEIMMKKKKIIWMKKEITRIIRITHMEWKNNLKKKKFRN